MWVISLGLVQLLQSVIFVNGVFEQLDKDYFIDSSRDLVINSPNYPNKYPSGSSGRYGIRSSLPYEVVVSCYIDFYKLDLHLLHNFNCSGETCENITEIRDLLDDIDNICDDDNSLMESTYNTRTSFNKHFEGSSSGCLDYFYISINGNKNLNGANQYCGKGNITKVSEFNKITIAYISNAAPGSGIGGTFSCRLFARLKPCDCGWSQQSRIVGGSPASITKYPYVVGIAETASKTVFCDGTIISAQAVLTAAHCVELIPNRDASKVYIMAGYTSLSSTTEYSQKYYVSVIIEHPYYSSSTQVNDIAILITSSNIVWSRGVGPVCLPLDITSTFDYVAALLVGFGTTSFGGPRSSTLLEADVNIITNADCQRAYPSLQSSQVCTYAQGRDACQFDSGGPAFVLASLRMYQIGIISYGKQCGGATPGVNTRITTHTDWVLNNAQATICHKPYQ